tara:strand:+ start:339 stop:461 length:123 start_codon:yes stop_codon:yes gene_type:complete
MEKNINMRKLPDLCAVDFDGSQQAVFIKWVMLFGHVSRNA